MFKDELFRMPHRATFTEELCQKPQVVLQRSADSGRAPAHAHGVSREIHRCGEYAESSCTSDLLEDSAANDFRTSARTKFMATHRLEVVYAGPTQ